MTVNKQTTREQRLETALGRIVSRCNYVRGLPPSDSYREGLRDGLSEARTIALEALQHGSDSDK